MSTENASQTFQKIYKSRIILLELLKSQNYNISDYEGISTTILHSMIETKQLDMLLQHNENDNKIYVKYQNILTKKLTVQNIDNMIEDLFEIESILEKKDKLLIITNDEPNDTLKAHLKTIWETQGIFIVVFNIKRLQFNILEHSMVPKHVILTEQQE